MNLRRKKPLFIAGVVLLPGLALASWFWLSHAGDRAHSWEEAVAEFERSGGSANYKEYVFDLIPEEKNFGAIQPLRGINIPEGVIDQNGLSGDEVRTAIAIEFFNFDPDKPSPENTVTSRGRPINLVSWEAFLAGEPPHALSNSPDPERAQRLMGLIQSKYQFFFDHSDPAATRPLAQFVPRIGDHLIPEKFLDYQPPGSRLLIDYGRVFYLRAALAAQLEDQETARLSILTLMHFGRMERDSAYGIMSPLVAATYLGFLSKSLWECIEHRCFDAPSLELIQSRMAEIDCIRSMVRAMRIEAILTCADIRNRKPIDLRDWPEFPPESLSPESIDRMCAEFLEIYNNVVIQPLRYRDFTAYHLQLEELQLATESGKVSSLEENPLTVLLRSPMMGFIVARDQTKANQALLACALERFYLKNETYPTNLTELIPEFIARIPEDPIDGNPMRYRKTPDGRYMLYSIGWDFEDNGGMPQSSPRFNIGEPGDLIWAFMDVEELHAEK